MTTTLKRAPLVGQARIYRQVMIVLEAYRNVREFDSPSEYLQALTEVLDDLCEAAGVEPPRIEGVFA